MRLKGCLGNPAISQLRQDAESATAAAQEARGAERTRLLDVAMDLRKRELDAWQACVTPEMPYGDLVGQSIASAGVAHVWLLRTQQQHADPQPRPFHFDALNLHVDLELQYMMLGQASEYLDLARNWYADAEAYCSGGDALAARIWYVDAEELDDAAADSPATLAQRDAVRSARIELDQYTNTHFVGQQVRVRGLVNAPHYNGCTGNCLKRHTTREAARYVVRLHSASGKGTDTLLVHKHNLERV
jgi:hypothetical protein